MTICIHKFMHKKRHTRDNITFCDNMNKRKERLKYGELNETCTLGFLCLHTKHKRCIA